MVCFLTCLFSDGIPFFVAGVGGHRASVLDIPTLL
jgi:hypothetical protein